MSFGTEPFGSSPFAVPNQTAAASGVYTLTADAVALTLSPQAADLNAGRVVTGDAVALTLSPQDATLVFGRVVTADAVALTLAPQDAGLTAGRVLTADPVALVLSPQDATLDYVPSGSTYTLTADAVALSLAPQDAGFLRGYVFIADPVALTLAAQAADLAYSGASQPAGDYGGRARRVKIGNKTFWSDEKRAIRRALQAFVEDIAEKQPQPAKKRPKPKRVELPEGESLALPVLLTATPDQIDLIRESLLALQARQSQIAAYLAALESAQAIEDEAIALLLLA